MLKQKISEIRIYFCLLILSCFLCPTLQAEPIIIRFSHVVAEDAPKGVGAKMFKEAVEARFPGEVAVQIFPKSVKYTDDQALIGLLLGDLEMAAPSFSKLCKFNRALEVFDLPFLFEDVSEVHSFQKTPAGQALLSSLEHSGIKGLAYWDNGMRVLATNKKIQVPRDLDGLKLRVEPSHVFQKQYAEIGVRTITMPFKFIPDALKIGAVDGYENTWSNIRSNNLHLLRQNFTEIGHSYLGYMVVTSNSFWERLPTEIRTELQAILNEVTVKVNRLATESNTLDKNMIMANPKVKITTLNESEKQVWKDAMMMVWKEFESDIGAELLAAAKKSKVNALAGIH